MEKFWPKYFEVDTNIEEIKKEFKGHIQAYADHYEGVDVGLTPEMQRELWGLQAVLWLLKNFEGID